MMRSAPSDWTASMTNNTIGRPSMACSTLGKSDFIRLPCPAARITAAMGTFDVDLFIVVEKRHVGLDAAPSDLEHHIVDEPGPPDPRGECEYSPPFRALQSGKIARAAQLGVVDAFDTGASQHIA